MHHISVQPGPPSKSTSKVDAAKRLLADSGYAGEPVTLMAPQEVPALKAWGDVTVDLLKRLDMKVDFAAVDAGTLFARSVQKSPPGQGN
jgi:peptide/nickel transport system substrate-binding protein